MDLAPFLNTTQRSKSNGYIEIYLATVLLEYFPLFLEKRPIAGW